MIRIGLKTPLDAVPEIAGVGFDCLELPLRDVAALSESEFAELTEYLAYLNVRVGAVSDLIPDGLRVNGPAVSAQAQHDYLSLAFARSNALGADIAAFDAPKARAVPAGFDFALARRQTGNFLRIAQGHAAQAKLHIAVMNYRRAGQDVHNASQISFCRVETQRHIDFLSLPPNASHFAGVMPVFYFL